MKWLRSFLTTNWQLKLTAVILAFILWVAVHGETSGERIITVPLEIQNTPRNTVITNDRPTSVELTIRGSVANVWFGATVPACVIDLRGTGEGERIIPLTPANVRIPRGAGLEVLAVSPPRVTLVLERTSSKTVPIRAALEGDVAPGFQIYSISVTPQNVILTGPRSHLVPITHVSTETIPIQAQRQTLRTFVHLNIPDPMIQTSQVRPVEVNLEVGEHRRTYTISQVPIVVDDPSVTVHPARVALQLLVPVSLKKNPTPADFTATVSSRDLAESSPEGRVKPQVHPVAGLSPAVVIKEVIPPMVAVRRGKK